VKVTVPNDSGRIRGKMHYVLSSELLCVVVVVQLPNIILWVCLITLYCSLIVSFCLCLFTNHDIPTCKLSARQTVHEHDQHLEP
jgi:hypothetical protein